MMVIVSSNTNLWSCCLTPFHGLMFPKGKIDGVLHASFDGCCSGVLRFGSLGQPIKPSRPHRMPSLPAPLFSPPQGCWGPRCGHRCAPLAASVAGSPPVLAVRPPVALGPGSVASGNAEPFCPRSRLFFAGRSTPDRNGPGWAEHAPGQQLPVAPQH